MLILATLAYVRPSDPTHPMRFDFLSLSIAVPLWLIGFVVVGVIAAILTVILWARTKTNKAPVRKTIDPEELRVIDLPRAFGSADAQTSQSPKKRADQAKAPTPIVANPQDEFSLVSPDKTEFLASSPDHFFLKISRYENEHAKGLLATVHNVGLLTIARITLRIISARSYDSRHSDYRDGITFKATAFTQQQQISGSESGAGMWFVRKSPSNSHLLAGSEESSPLKWPSNDNSVGHRWLVHLDVNGTRLPTPANAIPVALRPIDAEVILLWNKETNEFFIEPYQQPAPASPSSR